MLIKKEADVKQLWPEDIDKDKLYPTADVAKMFGVALPTVRYWVKKGHLDIVIVGVRRTFIPGRSIIQFIKRGEEKARKLREGE